MDLEFTDVEAEQFADKLMMIEQYAPAIVQQRNSRQEAKTNRDSQKAQKKSGRRSAPRKT